MSEDKVRTKDLCWSVGTLYDPRELPGVSTAGPGIGRGVTRTLLERGRRFLGWCDEKWHMTQPMKMEMLVARTLT
jgi:hypothetical protein